MNIALTCMSVFTGVAGIERILAASHFEGFALLIGSALIVQGVMAFVVVLQSRHRKAV